MWLSSDTNKKPFMHISIFMVGDNQLPKNIPLEENKQYQVEMMQKAGHFIVRIDGEVEWDVVSDPDCSARFENVQWYMSDPWHASTQEIASFTDMKVSPKV